MGQNSPLLQIVQHLQKKKEKKNQERGQVEHIISPFFLLFPPSRSQYCFSRNQLIFLFTCGTSSLRRGHILECAGDRSYIPEAFARVRVRRPRTGRSGGGRRWHPRALDRSAGVHFCEKTRKWQTQRENWKRRYRPNAVTQHTHLQSPRDQRRHP